MAPLVRRMCLRKRRFADEIGARLSMLKAALQIDSQHGPIAFGPKCAQRYIERPTRTAWKVLDRAPAKAQPADPAQMLLEFAC